MTNPSIRQPGVTPRGANPRDALVPAADPRTVDALVPAADPRPAHGVPVVAAVDHPLAFHAATLAPASRRHDPARPVLAAPVARRRPDAGPMRLMVGVLGLASAAAFTTAMLPSITPADAADPTAVEPAAVDPNAGAVVPDPSVRHVTRYVTLAPGQTAPPQSTVVVRPKPTPRVTVRVVTRTRQSGRP